MLTPVGALVGLVLEGLEGGQEWGGVGRKGGEEGNGGVGCDALKGGRGKGEAGKAGKREIGVKG